MKQISRMNTMPISPEIHILRGRTRSFERKLSFIKFGKNESKIKSTGDHGFCVERSVAKRKKNTASCFNSSNARDGIRYMDLVP